MHQKYVVKKLFHNNVEDKSLKNHLDVPKAYDDLMVECREIIRLRLRDEFTALRALYRKSDPDNKEGLNELVPRFFTQGSRAYKTQNFPCHLNQQLDLDDGVYFPMKFIESNPKASKRALLIVVKSVLNKLASEKGWIFSSKKMCFRLEVHRQIHVDVPVYAIPEEKYIQLVEAKSALNASFASMDIEKFQTLEPDQVYIALIDDNEPWKKSDPKELHNWFIAEKRRYPFLQNISRYLKAWRDYQWESGGPSSIMLMVATAKVLNDLPKQPELECEALLTITNALPEIFQEDINNPIDRDENMFPSRCKNEHEIADIREKVLELSNAISFAMCQAKNKQDSVDALRGVFGDRLPDREDWIKEKITASAIRKAPVVTTLVSTPSAAKSHVSA